MNIRLSTFKDLKKINKIYNQAVDSKYQTADTEHTTLEERITWFQNHNQTKFPVFVLEVAGEIVGWASLSIYRNRKALINTAEISYYLNKDSLGKGYGSQLMNFCITEAPKFGIKTLIAILLDKNLPSIGLLKKFGFEEWGRMPGIAEFDHIKCDHLYFGKHLT